MAEHHEMAQGAEQHTSPPKQPDRDAAAVETRWQPPPDGGAQLLQRVAGSDAKGAGGSPPPGTGKVTSLQRRQAKILGDAQLRHPMYAQRRAELFLQLQQTYGNAHARQVAHLLTQHKQSPALQRHGSAPGEAAAVTEEEAPLQRSASPEGADVTGEITGSTGRSQQLDGAARSKLEPAMGVDLTQVSIQADSRSHSVQAEAFTAGSAVSFRQGRYDPHSSGVTVSDPGASFEWAAEQQASQVMSRVTAAHVGQSSIPDIQRTAAQEEQEEKAPASPVGRLQRAYATGAEHDTKLQRHPDRAPIHQEGSALLLQRTPAAPTYDGVTGLPDPSKLTIDPIVDFLAGSLSASLAINPHVKDPALKHLSWLLYAPGDTLKAGYSTLPGTAGATTKPFTLEPADFSGNSFLPGKYLLRCVGLNAKHQPAVYADQAFTVEKEPKLLQDFAGKFPDAAALIRNSHEALKLVKEAEAAGSKFGGYSEDGPAKDAWPYTAGDSVYVPKAHTDKVVAMSDFLFELNNAIRKPEFDKLHAEGAKGSKGTLTAKDYAYKTVEQEVEGMLRLGAVWFETKKTMGGGAALDKYDAENYLAEYKDFQEGKKTKADIIKNVLKRVYPAGALKGKTVEQNYMEQYTSISGGK